MEILKAYWLDFFDQDVRSDDWWNRKKELDQKRNAEVVRINGNGRIYQWIRHGNEDKYSYLLHLSFLMNQNGHFYLEERVMPFQYRLKNGEILEHKKINPPESNADHGEEISPEFIRETDGGGERFSYNRLAAVQYAERWWNSYNPAYRTFDVDCTNFISQCLHAGGAPMRGAPNRAKGWWYQNDNWSYSWAVANALRWYLSGSTTGLTGKEMESAEQLSPGDVICYDFQGDGRWDHNTIVVTKDRYGMPLVNAHTDNSRHRYWSYEDSSAWTPNIQYKFFRIGE